MNNLLSIVNNFNLVIYTDENTLPHIQKSNNPRIMVIIRPLNEFYNYKYKEFWVKNHEKNQLLNTRIDWEVNMLWSEKIWFVNETIKQKYFDTDFYGWTDIGYFRNESGDLHTSQLQNWANPVKVNEVSNNKIHYGCVNNDSYYIDNLCNLVNNKNEVGLPREPIPADQTSVAGGFFILHYSLIDWWTKTYDEKLELYFKNDYLVKDDQVIIIDCIFSNMSYFHLYTERNNRFNNWFMFQRILN
jgi:hypothetical protein